MLKITSFFAKWRYMDQWRFQHQIIKVLKKQYQNILRRLLVIA